jgi:hypothetical protein
MIEVIVVFPSMRPFLSEAGEKPKQYKIIWHRPAVAGRAADAQQVVCG